MKFNTIRFIIRYFEVYIYIKYSKNKENWRKIYVIPLSNKERSRKKGINKERELNIIGKLYDYSWKVYDILYSETWKSLILYHEMKGV